MHHIFEQHPDNDPEYTHWILLIVAIATLTYLILK